MNNKLIKLTESDIKEIIKESVRNILQEYDYEDGHPYGWPDDYFDSEEDMQDNQKLTVDDVAKIEKCIDEIAEIANNKNDDCYGLYDAINTIEEFVEKKKNELLNFSKH